jgi:hypothetical protein
VEEINSANCRATPVAAAENLTVLKTADLEADPHGMFRRYRVARPFVGHEAGGYIVLVSGRYYAAWQ